MTTRTQNIPGEDAIVVLTESGREALVPGGPQVMDRVLTAAASGVQPILARDDGVWATIFGGTVVR